MSVKIKTT
jgi:hypothetical protein